jgi:hypothetical protein
MPISGTSIWKVGGYSPHASKELNQPTIAKRQRNGDIRYGDASRSQVDTGQHESGEGESTKTERSGISELPVLVRLPQSGLQGTAEGRSCHALAERGIVRVAGHEALVSRVRAIDVVCAGGVRHAVLLRLMVVRGGSHCVYPFGPDISNKTSRR